MSSQMDHYQLIRDLEKAIQGEYNAIQFYRALIPMAPVDHRKYIEQIGGDERNEHIKNFSNLYRHLTGKEPVVKPAELPTAYVPGLKKALDDEQEAAEFYQQVYLGSNDPYVRKIFFEAMTDEMRHATRLTFLYSNYFLENGNI